MTLEPKKRIALSSCILWVVCTILSFHRFTHHNAFHLASDILMLLMFWLLYSANKNKPQPDTLIHLFPTSPVNLKETPNS